MLYENRKSSSPDYERPPVVETVLGVQFNEIPEFKNAHLGAFWKSLDTEEWSTVSDAPPLETQFERFGEAAKWSKGLQIKISQYPASRIQIKNRIGDRMIQVQNGRLHFNWMGNGAENYRRFADVRSDFELVLGRFISFVAVENLGRVQPNQWEITYVNQIPKDTVWCTPADWAFFRPLGGVPDIKGLGEGESFNGEWHFVIPEKRGRLHVQWQHGAKLDAGQREMVVLTLTARGPVSGSDDIQGLVDGLNLGHDAIVWSFASLMSKAANEYWGLKNADSRA